MGTEWTTLRELLLPAATGGRRGKAVESALREAVRSGVLAAGTRLPSSRDLAGQLGLSRGTITALYEQLVAEGYLLSKHGSGTTVATLDQPEPSGQAAEEPAPTWEFDLRPGLPALSAFPRAEWLSYEREVLAAEPDRALGYPDPAGHPGLRAELASYLGRVRALPATAGDIVITNGAAEALSLLAKTLHARGQRRIAVEDPSHRGQAELLAAQGLRPIGIPVDDHGIQPDLLSTSDCATVMTTAAHQFPLGVPLDPERRRALLAWARETDGLIVEDDYDAEHRYDRPALGAVRALDPDRVVYLGSVSKVLAPALRIGWLVLPPDLRQEIVAAKYTHDLGCAPLPQAALARMLRSGGYDRHLRRTRRLYRQRRDALLDALSSRFPGWRPIGIAAGLHVVVRLPDGTNDVQLSRELAGRGINAPSLASYATGRLFPGLVLGYAALTPDRLRAAVDAMA
ncbi:GntR family transcriptional regulator / MocR family aminotransferase [Amycolatopsis xylanica]|uniref:GntR family transcriptional regulator / MocR family aminotransferase n=1 Tax=Amycolatopsis xylanica TaxID=589385 RepID=A0A1H3EF31_9PSEU|nr:PLP-dependent aminotransferase family protein [Amycolatopsis xylanica]SDX77217.1 GntR family transcriptional regulator / MocR family aminotransferase [Amycolatopsis xylanica]